MTISAKEWEVISFFETVPTPLDERIAWPYNEFTYEATRQNVTVFCALHPADHDIRIAISVSGRPLYEFAALRVQDVRYVAENATELLEIVLSDRESIRLALKPTVHIRHELDNSAP